MLTSFPRIATFLLVCHLPSRDDSGDSSSDGLQNDEQITTSASSSEHGIAIDPQAKESSERFEHRVVNLDGTDPMPVNVLSCMFVPQQLAQSHSVPDA
jgi:hypothetical protein